MLNIKNVAELINFSQVKTGLIQLTLMWGSFTVLKWASSSGALALDGQLMTILLWVINISTVVIGLVLSVRSLLIAILIWFVAIALYLLGHSDQSYIALGVSFVSVAAFYLGRILFLD